MRKRKIKDDAKEVSLSNWMGDSRLKENRSRGEGKSGWLELLSMRYYTPK